MAGYDEPDQNNISSLNPLVTPGVEVSDRNDNRCSIFDANDARALRNQAFIAHEGSSADKNVRVRLRGALHDDQNSNFSDVEDQEDGDKTPSDHLTRS